MDVEKLIDNSQVSSGPFPGYLEMSFKHRKKSCQILERLVDLSNTQWKHHSSGNELVGAGHGRI